MTTAHPHPGLIPTFLLLTRALVYPSPHFFQALVILSKRTSQDPVSTTVHPTLQIPKPRFQEQNKDVGPQSPKTQISWRKGETGRPRQTRTQGYRKCEIDLERSRSQDAEHRLPQPCSGALGADPSLTRATPVMPTRSPSGKLRPEPHPWQY